MSNENRLVLVVRLSTSTFWRGDGSISQEKNIRLLKSKSNGCLSDLIEDVSIDFGSITNRTDCEDGLYTLSTCNESYDHESGIVDGFDFILYEFIEESKS